MEVAKKILLGLLVAGVCGAVGAHFDRRLSERARHRAAGTLYALTAAIWLWRLAF